MPYVWGPVSGVHIPNICLWKARGLDGTIDVLTRIVFHYGKMIFGRSVHKALKRADFVFSATLTTQREFKLWHNRETCYMPENGLSIDPPSMAKYYIKGETLRLIWVGRIDSGKALTILLNALELISKENWVLDVFGDGPLRKNMEKKTNRYGIKEKVRFHGNVSRDVSKTAMSKAHLHIISSTMEATTTVLFEAMENGVPTMTLDHCGMAGVVCDKCGIKISIHSYKQIVHDMASNIQDIIVNPNKINILFKGVLECAKKYTWKKRVEIFNQAYNKAKEHFQSKRKESL